MAQQMRGRNLVLTLARPDSDYDARAPSWVRASHAQLDTPLWRAVSEWLVSDWPFGSVEYAPRTLAPPKAVQLDSGRGTSLNAGAGALPSPMADDVLP